MTNRHLLLLVSTLLAGCGSNSESSGCSLTIAIDGGPPVTKACIAGASIGITGPAAAQDNQVSIGQKGLRG